ncbi:hypothetical protein [Pseudomonas koreensis]|uniref:Uncharacterized protein n=1 Tax=Pseudomonas koreensis TaxID=198620 RepID=A0AA94ENZ1_9PSED|nr:hypothetical protein [Pseudomonas koreensis]RVD77052.1 hypothetical protein A9HBioS_3075 [Pseudomonas koreensis]
MNAAAHSLPRIGKAIIPCTPAEQSWLDDAVEHLMNRRDVQFKRRLHSPQGVTFERFALAIDEHVSEQFSAPGMSNSVIGRLIMHARCRSSSEAATTANEALNSADPDETLRSIAVELLRPLARDALIAQAEDGDL